VTEPSKADPRLTEVAGDLIRLFHGMPRQEPPALARDMTLGQIRLLFLLRREGAQPMGRIAEVFDLSSTAATGFVGRVESHGLVERRHRSDDRRIVECTLTEAGSSFLEALSGIRIESIGSALAALDPAELAEFHRLIRRINDRRGLPA
jgi:DNA-binding MarR family transcriptional regulator